MKLIIDAFPYVEQYGEDKAFELIKQAGYDGVDYFLAVNGMPKRMYMLGDDYREHAMQTKNLLLKHGLVCNQTHAPFGPISYARLNGDPYDCTNKYYLEIVRAIEYSALLGAKQIVIHAMRTPDGEDPVSCTVQYYKSYEPYAKKFGIKIAVENLMIIDETPELMNGILEQLDPEYFIACVDTGHANFVGVAPETFIREIIPGRLGALHIHDNDGTDDQHTIPYCGNIRWDAVAEALAETKYQGDFTYELACYSKYYAPELPLQALTFAAEVGRHLIGKIEAARK